MAIHTVRVTFNAFVEATTKEQIDTAINNLLDKLGETETEIHWDECEWDVIHSPEPLAREEARVE
jgi:hypothetical protein